MLKALGIGHRRVPDSVFGAPFAAAARRDFSDHLVVTDCHPSRRVEFTADLAVVRGAWPGMVADYPLDAPGSTLDWTSAVADLGTASAILTGGRDGAALALRAGVPFVALGLAGEAIDFIETLDGYPAAAADPARSLDARLASAIEARAWFVGGRGAVPDARPGRRFLASASEHGPHRPRRHLERRHRRRRRRRARTHSGRWQRAACRRRAGPARRGDSPASACARGAPTWPAGSIGPTATATRRRRRWRCRLPTTSSRRWWCRPTGSNTSKPSDLDAAVAELARVGRDTIVVEVSGRPVRAERAFAERLSDDWWRRRLGTLGLTPHEASDTLVTHGAGPTGGTLLVMSAHDAALPELPARACADRPHGAGARRRPHGRRRRAGPDAAPLTAMAPPHVDPQPALRPAAPAPAPERGVRFAPPPARGRRPRRPRRQPGRRHPRRQPRRHPRPRVSSGSAAPSIICAPIRPRSCCCRPTISTWRASRWRS